MTEQSQPLPDKERREKIVEHSRQTLQWLAAEHFNEQRDLKATDERLFNWAVSVFLAGFGALSGLRMASSAAWSLPWRATLWIGILIVIVGILLVARRVRRNFEQSQLELTNIISQLIQMGDESLLIPPLWDTSRSESQLGFYVRWGAVAFLALVIVVLIGLMG